MSDIITARCAAAAASTLSTRLLLLEKFASHEGTISLVIRVVGKGGIYETPPAVHTDTTKVQLSLQDNDCLFQTTQTAENVFYLTLDTRDSSGWGSLMVHEYTFN